MSHSSSENGARIQRAFTDVQQWLHLKMTKGHYSFGFAMELVNHQLNRIYNVHTIYDEIGRLEGTDERPGTTKKAAPFKGKILKDLWHKHHFQAGFMEQNMLLELNRPGVIEKVFKPHYGKLISDVMNEILHEVTTGSYEHRADGKRLTGEWIVFEKNKDVNYYLTLASHEEDDSAIKARVDEYKKVDKFIAEVRGVSKLC